MVGKLKDRAGQRIGRLTIVSFARREHYDGGTKIFWLCRCDCGAEKVINAVKKYARRLGICYKSVRFRVRKHNETVSEAVRGLLSRRAA